MDVKIFWRKVRETEASIAEPYPVIKSLETADGGRAGKLSEVSRKDAAKLLVEGRAVLASGDERAQYETDRKNEAKAAEKAELASRFQIALLDEISTELSHTCKRRKEKAE